jgi:hypothetical protein
MVTARRQPKPADTGILIPSASPAGPVSSVASQLCKEECRVAAPLTPSGRPRSAAIE